MRRNTFGCKVPNGRVVICVGPQILRASMLSCAGRLELVREEGIGENSPERDTSAQRATKATR